MKIASTKYSDGALSFALLVLRLGLGLIMMVTHGYDKLQHFSKYSASFSDPFHLGSRVSLSLDIFAEFFCSCLIVLGLFTRLACIPLIIAMSVALFNAHQGDAFGNGERAALYLAGYIALLFVGPGKVSIDKLIGK
ncbi:MAG TPA: DoxX family protein [Chitinophagaceae bacterium]|jgi:putative oxidoreductase|nr:DoxX family protein [Chitinophagaceae bacterium]